MNGKIVIAELPVDTFVREYAQDELKEAQGELKEAQEGYPEHGAQSICHSCVFGFTLSCGRDEFNGPSLSTICTCPCLSKHLCVKNVTNCNGYVEGPFDLMRFGIEKACGSIPKKKAMETEAEVEAEAEAESEAEAGVLEQDGKKKESEEEG
jgi:hypothetical protein